MFLPLCTIVVAAHHDQEDDQHQEEASRDSIHYCWGEGDGDSVISHDHYWSMEQNEKMCQSTYNNDTACKVERDIWHLMFVQHIWLIYFSECFTVWMKG